VKKIVLFLLSVILAFYSSSAYGDESSKILYYIDSINSVDQMIEALKDVSLDIDVSSADSSRKRK